jgi:hypothetical protein
VISRLIEWEGKTVGTSDQSGCAGKKEGGERTRCLCSARNTLLVPRMEQLNPIYSAIWGVYESESIPNHLRTGMRPYLESNSGLVDNSDVGIPVVLLARYKICVTTEESIRAPHQLRKKRRSTRKSSQVKLHRVPAFRPFCKLGKRW